MLFELLRLPVALTHCHILPFVSVIAVTNEKEPM